MPVDLRLQPLDSLVREHPGWRSVLEGLGITGRDAAGLTLGAAAERAGLDVETVLAAMAGGGEERWRCDNVAGAPLRALVHHIEEVHHGLMRRQFAEIATVLARRRREEPEDRHLDVVEDRFTAFRTEMEAHLDAEEQVLFPLCLDLIDAFSWPSLHIGPIADPIHVLEHDHDHVGGLLARAVAACEPGSEAARMLEEVEADLHRHLVEENDVLFPAALRLAEELTRA